MGPFLHLVPSTALCIYEFFRKDTWFNPPNTPSKVYKSGKTLNFKIRQNFQISEKGHLCLKIHKKDVSAGVCDYFNIKIYL